MVMMITMINLKPYISKSVCPLYTIAIRVFSNQINSIQIYFAIKDN